MSLVIDNGNVNAVSPGDGWTPKLVGDVFCSPLCGSKCKKVDFDRATEQANSLALQLGDGWQPQVWENCGWYFEVKKGPATVTVERNGLYEASIRFCFDQAQEQCIAATRDNPREAVEAVIDDLNGKIAVFKRALLSLSLATPEIPYV